MVYLACFDVILLQKHLCNLGKKLIRIQWLLVNTLGYWSSNIGCFFFFGCKIVRKKTVHFIRGRRESTGTLLAYLFWYSLQWRMYEIEDKASKACLNLLAKKWNRGILSGFSTCNYLRLATWIMCHSKVSHIILTSEMAVLSAC